MYNVATASGSILPVSSHRGIALVFVMRRFLRISSVILNGSLRDLLYASCLNLCRFV